MILFVAGKDINVLLAIHVELFGGYLRNIFG